MATTTTRSSSRKTKKTPPAPTGLHEAAVREIVTHEVRTAIRDQSREIEKHLNNIDERLRALEGR